MAQEHHLTCPICGRHFVVRYDSVVIGRKRTYCSSSCKDRKIPLDIHYFDTLTKESLHTLGQLVACSTLIDFQTIQIRSNEVTLTKILKDLKTNYPIQKAQEGLYLTKITSKVLVMKLLDLGIVNNQFYQEIPPSDCYSGIFDTHWYSNGEFRHPSYKLVLELQSRFGGDIRTETYKEVFKGVLGCYWVLSGIEKNPPNLVG